MEWEVLEENTYQSAKGQTIEEKVERTWLPDGWLVKMIVFSSDLKKISYQGGVSGGIGVGVGTGGGLTYVHDPDHLWKVKKIR